jgi:predicted Holliday junction resolvase-like endonuclease
MGLETTELSVCELIKNVLPTSIKEFILIIGICCLIYYIYRSQEEIMELKRENELYEMHLKNIIKGDKEDIDKVKGYFENVDENNKSRKEIDNFKKKKEEINKDAY